MPGSARRTRRPARNRTSSSRLPPDPKTKKTVCGHQFCTPFRRGRALPCRMRAEAVDTMNTLPTQADDAALLRAFSERGDRQAMNVLFARHADAAFRVALRCCRNAADAQGAGPPAVIQR